jgi:uncharacterized membrane protein YdcZ (DUF606 family)
MKKGQDFQKCKCYAFGLMYIEFGFISGILSPFGTAVVIQLRKLTQYNSAVCFLSGAF